MIEPGGYTADSSRHLTVFYTGLYRALTFPRKLEEIDENGKVVHYSPYDPSGGVHDGPLVTDNGFWDTYRTVYPLLSLAYPDELGSIVQGRSQYFSPPHDICIYNQYLRVVECLRRRWMVAFLGESWLSKLHGWNICGCRCCRCNCEKYQGFQHGTSRCGYP